MSFYNQIICLLIMLMALSARGIEFTADTVILPQEEFGRIMVEHAQDELNYEYIRFSSDDSKIFSIDPDGYYFAHAQGTTIIRVYYSQPATTSSSDSLVVIVRENCNDVTFEEDSICHGADLMLKNPELYTWYYGYILDDSLSVENFIPTWNFEAGHNHIYARKHEASCSDPLMPFSFYLIPHSGRKDVPDFDIICTDALLFEGDSVRWLSDPHKDSVLTISSDIPDKQLGTYSYYIQSDGACPGPMQPISFSVKDCFQGGHTLKGYVHGIDDTSARIYLLNDAYKPVDSAMCINGEFALNTQIDGSYTLSVVSKQNAFDDWYFGNVTSIGSAYWLDVKSSISGLDLYFDRVTTQTNIEELHRESDRFQLFDLKGNVVPIKDPYDYSPITKGTYIRVSEQNGIKKGTILYIH